MNEKEISQALRSRKIYREEAVEMHTQLAGLFAFYSEQLEPVLLRETNVWNKLRINNKTVSETDRAYNATEDGKNKIGLEMRLKSIGKMMSALKVIIENQTTEYVHTK